MSLLLAFLLLATSSQAALRRFNLTMSRGYASPDCFQRPVIKVNNQFPGPTIRVNTGDDVEILVTNLLIGEELSIHWHGIYQLGTPWMDGPVYISQCPIPSHGSMVYKFTVGDQAGTFWWHAHNSVLRTEGVQGAFIIDGPYRGCAQEPFTNQYDEELLISLTDWYHQPTSTILTGLDTPGQFTFPGNGDSVLFNGKGQSLNWQNNSNSYSCAPTNCSACPREVINIQSGKRYRLRLINMAALSFFNFAIEGHNLTIVEADGTPTIPVTVETLDISAGQRYSVIFTANQTQRSYWITAQTRWRGNPFTANPSGTAILNYVSNSTSNSSVAIPPTPIPDSRARSTFNFLTLQTLPSVAQFIPRSTKTVLLKVTQQYYPVNQTQGGQLRWPMNGVPYFLPSTPTLWLSYLGLTNRLAKESKMISLSYGDVVDVVIQNGAAANGVCENHPWHLHGHGMWLIAAGNGSYPNNVTFNGGSSPLFRDTVTLLPSIYYNGSPNGPAGSDCGWIKLRFQAKNPGTWPFHCHVEWHMQMGMMVVFESAPSRIPDPPSGFPPCGIVPFSTPGN